jgi:putative transposase
MRYSQYVHRKKKKKGHLWQGRFFSCVLSPGHLYRAVRYVEQNPVRAQIVSKPWDYIWSSAKQHIGNEMEPIIKTEDAMNVLDIYGRVENWKSYLEEEDVHMLGEIRRVTHKGLALGSKEFVLNLEKKIGLRLRELKAGRPLTLKK